LIVPPSEFIAWWVGFDVQLWVEQVVAEIRLHTDRKILVKGRQKGGLEQALGDAWCIVTYNSMAACHALAAGVPSLVLAPGHVASCVSWKWEDIESPAWPDREPWAHACAYHQWQLRELRECRKLEIGTSRSITKSPDETSTLPENITIADHIFGPVI